MSAVELDDFRKPFFCSWKLRFEAAGENTFDSEVYSSLEEAKSKYQKVKSDSEMLAYLGEVGLFDKKGVFIDWITFETNDTELWSRFGVEETHVSRNTRGFGMPESVEELKKPYAVYYKIVDNPRKP